MLEELEIKNLGPIREAVICPDPSMTAVTGETGAGKSMLLSAFGLICGSSSRSERIAPGEKQSWAQGIFSISQDEQSAVLAAAAGADLSDGEIFLSRQVPASGRSRAMLNGRTAPKSLLRDISANLVSVHGQADQLRLASEVRQRQFLDRYAHNEHIFEKYRAAWKKYSDSLSALTSAMDRRHDALERLDYLKDAVSVINSVNPEKNEDEELLKRRERIENAADISRNIKNALVSLDSSFDSSQNGSEDSPEKGSVVNLIDEAILSLKDVPEQKAKEFASRLESVSAEIGDIVYQLAGYEDDDLSSPADLDAINERIYALSELTRRWGPDLDDVIEWRDKAEAEIEESDAGPERIEKLKRETVENRAAAYEAALKLSRTRVEAAKKLSEKVTHELKSLAMSGSALAVEVKPRISKADLAAFRKSAEEKEREKNDFDEKSEQADSFGCDDISFLFKPFPDAPAMELGKSASGGELSRLMLALELAAFESDNESDNVSDKSSDNAGNAESCDETRKSQTSRRTLIFDEIDAGVGGKAAAELGKRLAKLAESAQIIVVTHLPQVACQANKQYTVVKQNEKSPNGETGDSSKPSVRTQICEVSGSEREKEIARMLSGSVSETSIKHARELLNSKI